MIPNFFCKEKIPDKLPEDLEEIINVELKTSKTKEECARKAYVILTEKYGGDRIKTYSRIFELFACDVAKLWSRSGFLHCSHLNYLLRITLVKSGFFKDEDIQLKWTQIWYISPHQYLRVKLDDEKYVNIDVWAHVYGIKFGDYAHGFH